LSALPSGRYISGRTRLWSRSRGHAEIRSFDGAARVIGGASATFARRWCARAGQRGGKRTGRRWLKPASGLAAVAVVELVSFGSSQVATGITRSAGRRMPPIPAAPPRPVALRRRIRGCAIHPGQPRNGHWGRRTPERSHRDLGS